MKRYFVMLMVVATVAMGAMGAVVENEYFSITTPDDSWFLTNDDALRPYGARVDISRLDAQGATLELARVDYLEGAFDPQLYLTRQVVEKKDVFCRSAQEFSSIFDYSLAGFVGKCVEFKKRSNNHDYQCEAVTFNAGFGTFMVIMAHRADQPSLIARIVGSLKCKVDTTRLVSAASYAAAAGAVVKRHHLPIGNNEHLSAVAMSADSSTVSLTVTVPYITRENVNVPAFVMTKRDAWLKQAPEALDFNLLLASAARERKNLRYFYADTKGNEIGTLLILPEEYEQVKAMKAAREQEEQARKLAQAQEAERVAQEKAKLAEQEAARQAAARAAEAAAAPVYHEVKRGESITRIAKHYGLSINDLRKINPGINIDKINIGQKIRIK